MAAHASTPVLVPGTSTPSEAKPPPPQHPACCRVRLLLGRASPSPPTEPRFGHALRRAVQVPIVPRPAEPPSPQQTNHSLPKHVPSDCSLTGPCSLIHWRERVTASNECPALQSLAASPAPAASTSGLPLQRPPIVLPCDLMPIFGNLKVCLPNAHKHSLARNHPVPQHAQHQNPTHHWPNKELLQLQQCEVHEKSL